MAGPAPSSANAWITPQKPPGDMFDHSQCSDLVRDSKIETRALESCLQHVFYETGRSARERHVRREERWVRQAFIGRGAYGSVYLEQCDLGGKSKVRAVKEIKKCVVPGEELDYTRELEAVAKFSHPRYSHCFVRSYGWFEIGDSIFISMEYLDHGDLQRYLTRPLPEVEAKQITSQVLEGLSLMHENGFVHRDLKPGNIMVVTKNPDWFVKITDFGISKRRQQDVTTLYTLQRGTLGFAAPEALGFPTPNSTYTFSVDMWSLGAVAYRMLTNKTAFQNVVDLIKYSEGIQHFPIGALEESGISQQARDFILTLMKPTPQDRLSAEYALNHRWITDKCQHIGKGPTENPYLAGPGITESDTLASAASKAWSTDNNTTYNSERTINGLETILRTINEEGLILPLENSEDITTDNLATAKLHKLSNYQPPSISNCPEEDEPYGINLPFDSEVLFETALPSNGLAIVSNSGEIRSGETHQNDSSSATETNKEGQYEFEPLMEILKKLDISDSGSISQNQDFADCNGEAGSVDYHVATDTSEPTVTCIGCRSRHPESGPVEHLPCHHFVCHKCLLESLALSLVSPKYMPPRCCDGLYGTGKINPESFKKLTLKPQLHAAWKYLRWFEEQAHNKVWSCPKGHCPQGGFLEVTMDFTPVWRDPIVCSGCLTRTYRPIRKDLEYNQGERRTEFCLFCASATNNCSCAKELFAIIDEFVDGLVKAEILGSSVLEEIVHALETKESVRRGGVSHYQTFAELKGIEPPEIYLHENEILPSDEYTLSYLGTEFMRDQLRNNAGKGRNRWANSPESRPHIMDRYAQVWDSQQPYLSKRDNYINGAPRIIITEETEDSRRLQKTHSLAKLEAKQHSHLEHAARYLARKGHSEAEAVGLAIPPPSSDYPSDEETAFTRQNPPQTWVYDISTDLAQQPGSSAEFTRNSRANLAYINGETNSDAVLQGMSAHDIMEWRLQVSEMRNEPLYQYCTRRTS